MKPKSKLHSFLALAGSSLLAISSAHAVDFYWDGGTATWNTASPNPWSSDAAGTDATSIPNSTTTANLFFNITSQNSAANTISLGGGERNARSLTFNTSGTTNLRAGGSGSATATLNIGAGGITINNTSGAVTIGQTPTSYGTLTTALAASQSWTHNDDSTFTVVGPVSLGANTLTLAGNGAGAITLSGKISGAGAVELNKTGGAVTLNTANDFAGGFTLTSGQVNGLAAGTYAGFGTGTLTLKGGTINTTSHSSTTTVSNDMIWNGAITFSRATSGSPTLQFDGNVSMAGNFAASTSATAPPGAIIFAGNISETGGGAKSLTLTSSGAPYTLSGNNSYTGGTNITGSTVVQFAKAASIGNSATTAGAGAVSMANGTRLVVNAGGSGEFNGLTDGSVGSISRLLEAGTQVTWNGTSNFGIDTTNASGGSFTYDGTVLNRGTSMAIHKYGAGTLRLSKTDSSYTGVTTIREGTLEVVKLADGGSSSSIGASTSSATNLQFLNSSAFGTLRHVGSENSSTNRGFTTSNGVGGGARIESSGAGTLTFVSGGGSISYGTAGGTNAENTQSRLIIFGGTNTGDNTFAKIIANNSGTNLQQTSVTKEGVGKWILSAENTYTGATDVTTGTLIVDGNISTSLLTTVQTGATLGGSGTVGAATIHGVLSPGNSLGTLTATGDVTWNDNDAWVFELGSAASTLALANTTSGISDLLDITGGNDFLKGTGSSFTFDFAGGGMAGWYKLVDWTGTTTFAGNDFLATNLGTGLSGTFTVDSGTSALYLNVIPEPRAALLGGLGLLMLLRRRRN